MNKTVWFFIECAPPIVVFGAVSHALGGNTPLWLTVTIIICLSLYGALKVFGARHGLE